MSLQPPTSPEDGPAPARPSRSSPWSRIRLAVNTVFVVLLLGSAIPVLYLTARPAVGGDKRIHLRFMFWGGPEQLVQEQEVRAAFYDYLRRMGRDDIQLELLGAGLRYHSKLAAMMSGHQAPDIFMVHPGSIAKFADRERPLMVDVTDLTARDREEMDFDDLLPEAVRTFYCNGRLYGFPRDYKTTGVGYNADMLAEIGLEDPNDLYDRDEWTWATFRDYLVRLNREVVGPDGKPRHVFGLFQDSFSEGYWHNIMLQAGGAIWSDDGRELTVDLPESIRGLQFVYDLAWKHRIAKQWSPALGANNPWVARETAMLGYRGWHTSSFIKQTYNTTDQVFSYAWDVAPWPLGPQMDYDPQRVTDARGETTGWRLGSGRVVLPGAVHWIGGREGRGPFRLRQCTAVGIGYVMSVDSKHKDEAWMLLKFLVGPEAQKIRAKFEWRIGDEVITIPGPNMPSRESLVEYYLDMARNTPVRPTFSGCLAKKNRQPLWPRIDVFIDARKYGKAPTGAMGQEEIDRELSRHFERMLMYPPEEPESITPEQVAQGARARAEKVYRRLRGSPFRSSYNDPSLVRPPEEDPLGLAPRHGRTPTTHPDREPM